MGSALMPMSNHSACGQSLSTWEELGTREHHTQMIRELIARDKNHPCVVMWSIANEPASEEEGAYEYFQPLVQLARDRDPQKRPVTIVIYMMATPNWRFPTLGTNHKCCSV